MTFRELVSPDLARSRPRRFAPLLFARFFKMAMRTYFAHNPLAIHLLLQTSQGAIDVLAFSNFHFGNDQLNHPISKLCVTLRQPAGMCPSNR